MDSSITQAIQTALEHHKAGRLPQAEAMFQQILQVEPNHSDVLHFLGIIAFQSGKKERAIEFISKAININPSSVLHYNLGLVLSAQGKLAAAIESYRQALVLKPDNYEAHNNIGIALKEQGRMGEAIKHYRTALLVKPDDFRAHNNIGNARKEQRRFNEAIRHYRNALLIKPDYVEAQNNLEYALKEQSKSEAIAECCHHVPLIKMEDVEAYYDLGIAFHAQGELDAAVKYYRHALALKPDFAEAHNGIGNILRGLGRLDDALACYQQAIQVKPDFAVAYYNMGNTLRSIGRLDEALVCYQQLAKLKPEDGETQHHIASLTGNNTERAPIQYVESLFDDYADEFDTQLQQVLKYQTPEKVVALVTQHSIPPAEKWNILDLGCGTGLVGSAIAQFARQLVGVDLSAKMLEKARARNLYQRLERLDLLTMMRGETDSSYDVIIASDVFVYLGRIDEIVSEIKRLVCPGGIVAFSIEILEELSDEVASQDFQREYQLENTGRYSHSSDYITMLAAANGFLQLEMAATQIRIQEGKPVNGHLVLWKN